MIYHSSHTKTSADFLVFLKPNIDMQGLLWPT